jgi:Putative auto-transporter adhesin, head GIN domain
MRIVLIVLPLLALAACGATDGKLRNAGPDGARNFDVSGFTAVSLEGSDNVRVVHGATTSVTAIGPQEVLDLLNIRVERNTLKIDRKSGRANWLRGDYRGATITVTMPTITAAAVAGSGNMTVDRAASDGFEAAVEGSGNLKVASITVKRTRLAAEGSGNLSVSGTTDAYRWPPKDRAVSTRAASSASGRRLR